MPENTIVSKTFTYPKPDDYLAQTSNDNLTGTFTYNGPNKIWIFVDAETGKPTSGMYYTERDNGADVPTPQGELKILVEADREPEVISLVLADTDYGSLPTIDETLPDGNVYSRPIDPPPDHTYEFMDCVYDITADVNGGHWVRPLPWKKPYNNWDEIRQVRNGLLAVSDQDIQKATTPEKITEFEDYRQKLRDLPALYDGIESHKVHFPPEPRVE